MKEAKSLVSFRSIKQDHLAQENHSEKLRLLKAEARESCKGKLFVAVVIDMY